MATKAGHGPGAAYQRGGFAAVWKWAKGHSLKRWIKARNWAKRRAALAGPNRDAFLKAEAVYAKKVEWLQTHKDPHYPPSTMGENFVVYDGHDLPKWIAAVNDRARASGIWKGQVFSGVRSPEYSESLCEHMCGAPTCPGRCAGRSSNHACPPDGKGTPHEGAEDVTDYAGLEAYCRSHSEPLYGGGYALPSDLPHFSGTGR